MHALPPDFTQKADHFTQLLLGYNRTHNISGAKEASSVARSIEDSIYPLNFLPTTQYKTMIDIGSGAGFPGIVLSLALPHLHVSLFEPIAKKSAFLHLAKSHLALENVTIYTQRVEAVTPWPVDLITSRAVSETKMLLKLCSGFIAPHTHLLFYKGERVGEEMRGIKGGEVIVQGKRHYLWLKESYVA